MSHILKKAISNQLALGKNWKTVCLKINNLCKI